MVIVCWVLAVLALLVLAVCLLPVGARAVFTERSVTVTAFVGPIRFQVYPEREKTATETPQAAEQAQAPQDRGKKRALPPLRALREAARLLWPPLRRALERTRRGMRVTPLTLSVTLGGARDPAETAELYGWLHGAVWGGMPVLEQLLVIPDPRIHIGMEFDSPEPRLEGSVGIRARVGTLLTAGLGVAVPVLRWLSQMEKRNRDRKAGTPSEGARSAA